MTWIAVSPPMPEQSPATYDTATHETVSALKSSSKTLLERGSLLLETRLVAAERPVRVIDLAYDHPWRGRISLYLVPGGSLALVITQGIEVRHAVLPVTGCDHGRPLRLTFRWDAPEGRAVLWAEQPGQVTPPVSVQMNDPLPLPRTPLILAADQLPRGIIGDMVDVMAVSDREEPVGPMPGLSGRSMIATPHGPRRADTLKRGDLVMVPGGGALPILAAISRVVPARGDFAPVRIEAPRFGLKQDIMVAAGQRMVITGSDVEYLFGSENVLVPARHLIGERIGSYCRPRRTVSYVQFLLPRQEPLIVGGAAMESLHVGRLRRRPDLIRDSLLMDYSRATLPDHPIAAYPVLNGFEAVTLAGYRAA